MDATNNVRRLRNTQADTLEKCPVVDTVFNLMLSDKLQLDSLRIFKVNFKDYAIEKLACKTFSENCRKKEYCENIIYMNVSCSMCIFELDNTANPCVYTLDRNTTYANTLN